MTNYYALYLPLLFPEGLAAGNGSDYNVLRLARDGQNRPVLRGTSLAGVLRHTCAKNNQTVANRFFGVAEGEEYYRGQTSADKPSLIEIPDSVLEFPGTQTDSRQRTHHLRNRHTGTVLDKGLFSIQSCLPGTQCGSVVWLNASEISDDEALNFLREITGYFDSSCGGLLVGGNAARGVGRAILNGAARLCTFDLSKPDQYGLYLDSRRKVAGSDSRAKMERIVSESKWTAFQGVDNRTNCLTIQFTLTIPRGQDILIADGSGVNAGMEPQRVVKADGKTYWQLPGSSLRGLFRSWITRLAAREGKIVADSANLYELRSQDGCQKDQAYTGANLAWAFIQQQNRKDKQPESNCPIINLFGSAFKRGRIHFSDSFCLCDEQDQYKNSAFSEVEQFRMHLKIDPISGGNADGALFNNTVLTSAKQPRFDIVLQMENPSKEECSWVVSTLRALNTGVLRIGSSKASGRVQLVGNTIVNGHNWNVDEDILKLFRARENDADTSDSQEKIEIKIEPNAPKVQKNQPQLSSGEKSYIGFVMMDMASRGLPQKKVRFENPTVKITGNIPPEALKPFTPNSRIRVIVDANNRFVRIESYLIAQVSAPEEIDNSPVKIKKANQAATSLLGAPFFNPYTFIPFKDKPFRKDKPTLRTADEIESDRVSGYIEMEIKTLRPLMTLFPKAINEAQKGMQPQKFQSLTIGKDVIVPATAIRGAMRNLMMILTGGSLGNLNPNAYACQGRDCQLGPVNPNFAGAEIADNIPRKAFLAEVISPGSANKPGVIRVGKCRFVQREELIYMYYTEAALTDAYDSACKKKEYLLFDLEFDQNTKQYIPQTYDPQSGEQPWKLKLSGRPISPRYKREGLYQSDPEAEDIPVPAELWNQYSSRNAAGVHPTLYKGDLIWLEHVDVKGMTITKTEEIKSLQWARWGRTGDRLMDLVKPEFQPDTTRKDKKVDWVTDLFGQVSDTGDKTLPAFAGRIRPENLVFENAKGNCYNNIQLAPMSMPHPGCVGFYRDYDHLQEGKMMLRGYKVYRNALENEKPWEYSAQGIYGDYAELKGFNSNPKMNRSADLLAENSVGHLRIAFQGLSQQELGMLYKTCSTLWRLGGGKPLGLGLCQTKNIHVFILNDDGTVTEDLEHEYQMTDEMKLRLLNQTRCWEASQKGVPNMRYPRAVSTNNNKKNRGGHAWFSLRAKTRANSKKELECLKLNSELHDKLKLPRDILEIAPQWLPLFDPDNPNQDCLYGYDLFFTFDLENVKGNNINYCTGFEPFDPAKHVTGNEHSGGNFSQNRESRNEQKKERGKRSGEE